MYHLMQITFQPIAILLNYRIKIKNLILMAYIQQQELAEFLDFSFKLKNYYFFLKSSIGGFFVPFSLNFYDFVLFLFLLLFYDFPINFEFKNTGIKFGVCKYIFV